VTAREGWRQALPELAVAAILGLVATAAGYGWAGLGGLTVAVVGVTVAALVTARWMLPPGERPAGYDQVAGQRAAMITVLTGYWRRRGGLEEGVRALTAYDAELRLVLQSLLAARLAEHHGIDLRDDPATARELLCPRSQDRDLWYWVDPDRAAATDGTKPGIPQRTLTRLIERLEQI
jgi:hypothetical protein